MLSGEVIAHVLILSGAVEDPELEASQEAKGLLLDPNRQGLIHGLSHVLTRKDD